MTCSGALHIGRRGNCSETHRYGRKTFGRLKVLRRHEQNGIQGKPRWYCVCSCGKETVVHGASLRQNLTHSCGCIRSEVCKERRRKRPYEYLYNIIVARSEGSPCLTYEEFVEFTKDPHCHYCEAEVVWFMYGFADKIRGSNAYNIDRKDSMKGYEKENCIVCCPRCNRSKSNTFSYEEWVEVGKAIKRFRRRQCK